MTIKETMLEMYHDGVYGAAMLRDRERAEEVIREKEDYYRENPTDPWAWVPFPEMETKPTYEESLAKGMHERLYKVALQAWCRTYSREQMLQLLTLLATGEAGTLYVHMRICQGGEEETVDTLMTAWNESNPDAEPIRRAAPDIG